MTMAEYAQNRTEQNRTEQNRTEQNSDNCTQIRENFQTSYRIRNAFRHGL